MAKAARKAGNASTLKKALTPAPMLENGKDAQSRRSSCLSLSRLIVSARFREGSFFIEGFGRTTVESFADRGP
jgi:hypothetical protein